MAKAQTYLESTFWPELIQICVDGCDCGLPPCSSFWAKWWSAEQTLFVSQIDKRMEAATKLDDKSEPLEWQIQKGRRAVYRLLASDAHNNSCLGEFFSFVIALSRSSCVLVVVILKKIFLYRGRSAKELFLLLPLGMWDHRMKSWRLLFYDSPEILRLWEWC